MYDKEVNLTNCDQEPIHLIGAVQPCGVLIGAEPGSLSITHVSENVEESLAYRPDALFGMSLDDILVADQCEALRSASWAPASPDLIRSFTATVRTGSGVDLDFDCMAHESDGTLVLELVPIIPSAYRDPSSRAEVRSALLSVLNNSASLQEIYGQGIDLIRDVIGYDRVMLYRFHADLHGEVVAESTDRDDRFLGLHYPASDIPAPARRHFELNLVRVISDIEAEPVSLVADPSRGPDRPLDLTFSKLRAVSPIHVEYLRNMGVRATLSISLVVNGSLIGLFACHNYTPKMLSATDLRMAEYLGQILSFAIGYRENLGRLQSLQAARDMMGLIEDAFDVRGSVARAVEEHADLLMKSTRADGIQCRVAESMVQCGSLDGCPVDFSALLSGDEDGLIFSDRVRDLVGSDDSIPDHVAGGAFVPLSSHNEDYIFFARGELDNSIDWAGKPEKPEKIDLDGKVTLSPRRSFALYREQILGRSAPFSDEERERLAVIGRSLRLLASTEREHRAEVARLRAEAEEAELRLTLLNTARTGAVGELASILSHELHQPLTAVLNYVNACRQELRELSPAAPDEIHEMMGEAVEQTQRASDILRKLRRFVEQGETDRTTFDLGRLVETTARRAVDAELAGDVDLLVELPGGGGVVNADRTQIEQVVFNLVRNSVEAMTEAEEKSLRIAVSSDDPRFVTVSVLDSGPGIPEETMDLVFQPFSSTKNDGMGIGLSLCRRIIETHAGRIWAENLDGGGAAFHFKIPAGEVEDEEDAGPAGNG